MKILKLKILKNLLLFLVFSVGIFLYFLNSSSVYAETVPESTAVLQAKLLALQAQVAALQAQAQSESTVTKFNRNLTIGSKGADVAVLQTWLISKNFLVIPRGVSKGYFGAVTRSALASWQRVAKITPAVGYFGPTTRARLNSILFPNATLPSTPSTPTPVPPPPPPPNSQSFSVRCSPSTTQIGIGGSITWQAYITGSSGTYTYSWQGSDGLNGSGAGIQKTYNTAGTKTASVKINNQNTFECDSSVNVTEQLPPPPPPQLITVRDFSVDVYKDQSVVKYADRSIAWYTVGGRSTYMPYRLAWREIDPLPVSYWVNGQLSSELSSTLSRGYQRIFLHNPFGQSPYITLPSGCVEGGMQFDQYLEALVSTPWLVNNFVEAWRPVVESGIEVISYVGSPDSYSPGSTNGDCEQEALKPTPEAWWTRAWQALQPFLDSGMSIGFDAAVGTSRDSYTFQLAEALRARGVRVYVESIPEARNPHWASYPFIIDNDNWWFTTQPFSVPLSQLTGEIFRFVKYPVNRQSDINQILTDGYTSEINWFLPIRSAIVDYVDPTVIIDLPSNSNGPSGAIYSIKTNPTGGQLSPIGSSSSGRYLYTANSGFLGVDSITYTAKVGTNESLPARVSINVHAEMPFVNAVQLMSAARQAGAGSAKVVAIWPLFEKEIQNLGIQGMISSNMIPKRVITFQIGGSPVSYIAGYDKNTFAPMAVSAGRLLVARADSSSGPQYAAALESKLTKFFINPFVNFWNSLVKFWMVTVFSN